MKYCHKCGAKLEEDSRFCRLCGTKVIRDEEVTPVSVEKPDFVVEPNFVEKPDFIVEHNMVEKPNFIVEPIFVEQPDFVVKPLSVEKHNFVVESVSAEKPDFVVEHNLVEKSDFVLEPILVERPDFVVDPVCSEDKVQNQGNPQQRNEPVSNNVASSEMQQGKRKSKTKLILFVTVPIVAIIILIIVISVLRSGNTSFDFYGVDCISMTSDHDTAYIITPDRKLAEIDTNYTNVKNNMNLTKMAVIKDYNREEGGDLYVIDASGEQQIDENVTNYIISDSGDGIAYLTNYDNEEETATLMLYTDGKSKKISDEVYVSGSEKSNLVISPDGKTVAYTIYKDEKTGYISVNGKSSKKIGENKICFAVSDDANYIYYKDFNGGSEEVDVYVKAGDDETRLVVSDSSVMGLAFNKDYSQAMFSYDGKTYISINGEDKAKLLDSSSDVYLIRPNNAILNYEYNGNLTYATDSFIGKLFMSEHDIFYLNHDLVMVKVGDSASSYGVTADVDTLVYSDSSGDLYVVTNLSSDNSKKKKLNQAEDVEYIKIIEDADQIYYVNKYKELHVISQENKDRKIADDVSANFISIVGERLFFFNDYDGAYGTLMYTTGSKTEKVQDAEQVSGFYQFGAGIICFSGELEETTIYGSVDGKKFNKIIKDINISD